MVLDMVLAARPAEEEGVAGDALKALRVRCGLSLADMGREWPDRPIRRQGVAAVEVLGRVSPERADRYLAALTAALDKARGPS